MSATNIAMRKGEASVSECHVITIIITIITNITISFNITNITISIITTSSNIIITSSNTTSECHVAERPGWNK